MEITGKLIKKLPQEGGTSKAGKPWTKDAFVLQLEGTFPRELKIDIFNNTEKSQFINDTNIDTVLKCDINLDSKEYNGRYFHNVTLWKVEVVRDMGNESFKANDIPEPPVDDGNEDLPF